MDGKTYLKNILYINADIDSRLYMAKGIDRLMAISFEDSSKIGLLKHRDEIIEDTKEVAKLKDECTKLIDSMEDPIYRIVLREFYLNQHSISEIAEQIYYTNRQVSNLKAKAIDEFSIIYEREKIMSETNELKAFLEDEYGELEHFKIKGLLEGKTIKTNTSNGSTIVLSLKEPKSKCDDRYMLDYQGHEIYVSYHNKRR